MNILTTTTKNLTEVFLSKELGWGTTVEQMGWWQIYALWHKVFRKYGLKEAALISGDL